MTGGVVKVGLPSVAGHAAVPAPRARRTGLADVLLPPVYGLVVFWCLVGLLTPSHPSPSASMFAAAASGFVGLAVSMIVSRRKGILSDGLVLFGLGMYLLRLWVGIWHYMTFFDPTYFDQTTPIYHYLWDFEYLSQMASSFADAWRTQGFSTEQFSLLATAKNTLTLPYFAMLYYIQGADHFLNFSVLNSMHACLVAVLVSGFAKRVGGYALARTTFVVAMLQPFGFISSMLWRDSVGQFFLLFGAVLIILGPTGLRGTAVDVVGSILSMLLRNVYFIVGVLTAAVKGLRAPGGMRKPSALVVVGAVLAMGLIYFSRQIFAYRVENAQFAFNLSLSSFTYNVIRGLLGPFPWTQMLDPHTNGWQYQLPDVLQAAYNLAILTVTGQAIANRTITSKKAITWPTLTFVGMIMAAGLVTYGHISYVTVASVLLLPLLPTLDLERFFGVFLGCTFFLFAAGYVWAVS